MRVRLRLLRGFLYSAAHPRLVHLLDVARRRDRLVYLLCAPAQNDLLQYFVGTIALAVYAEIMARVRRAPATGYLHVALLPMVPGGGIYYTMEYGIAGNTERFLETGMHTLGIAGSLALGILVVSSVARIAALMGEERRARRL